MGSDDIPPRRRQKDMPVGNIELILYQLSEIKSEVREGFQKMEGRFDRVEDRVGALERFRARQEQADEAAAANTTLINGRWVPLILTLLTLTATVILFLVGQGGS